MEISERKFVIVNEREPRLRIALVKNDVGLPSRADIRMHMPAHEIVRGEPPSTPDTMKKVYLLSDAK